MNSCLNEIYPQIGQICSWCCCHNFPMSLLCVNYVLWKLCCKIIAMDEYWKVWTEEMQMNAIEQSRKWCDWCMEWLPSWSNVTRALYTYYTYYVDSCVYANSQYAICHLLYWVLFPKLFKKIYHSCFNS